MCKTVIFFLTLISSQVYANETVMVIPSEVYDSSKLPHSFPQIFIFDNKGTIIHREIGVDYGLRRAFEKMVPIKNENETRKKILTVFNQIPDFSAYDFTLAFITDVNEKESCPPCLKQNMINRKVINVLNDKNIHLMTMPKEVLGELIVIIK